MAGLVIATWNVENLSSEAEDVEAKLGYIVSRLRQMEADVVALQEILDEQAAKRLAAQLSCEVTLGLPDGRGNRVGFLTRTKPARVQILSDWRLADGVIVQDLDANGDVIPLNQLSRPALKITVKYEDEEIDFINVHLKSKLLTFPGGRFSPENESERARVAYFALQRRAAEATTIREIVNELLERERHVVVLGDLNDGPHAATTEILYGPIGSQARGPEDALNENSGFNKKDSGDGQRLSTSRRWWSWSSAGRVGTRVRMSSSTTF